MPEHVRSAVAQRAVARLLGISEQWINCSNATDRGHHLSPPHHHASLKIAIAGKGGVGKTTVAAALARTLAQRHLKVLAIDADPDANLASGLPLDTPGIVPAPLAAQRDLLHAAASPSGALPAGLFLLNPVVDDVPIPTVSWGGQHRLVVLGWTGHGGQGCYCDENAVLQRVLTRIVAEAGEIIIVDGEPGLEHLSRGTLASVDVLVAVLEPGLRSVHTAQTIRNLAADLGIPHCLPLLSGSHDLNDARQIQHQLGNWPLLGSLPFDPAIALADLAGRVPVFGVAYQAEIDRVTTELLELQHRHHGPAKFAPRPHTHIGPDGKSYTHTHNVASDHDHEHS
jgi:CO dehydrogenase maturation factor